MHSHVAALLEAAQNVLSQGLEPNATLRALTTEFMKHYVGAAERQKVLLNELHHLPKDRRTIIIGIQNKLIDIVQDVLGKLRPDLAKSPLKRPAAMLYFGMINWTHTWMDPSGPAKPPKIAELSANVFLDGFLDAALPR
jgi:hypothetical protein